MKMKYGNTRQQKKAAVSAVKQIKKRKLPSKVHGKAVMVDDPRKPGRKMGYASVTKTKLPDYKPKKMKKPAVRKKSTQRKSY